MDNLATGGKDLSSAIRLRDAEDKFQLVAEVRTLRTCNAALARAAHAAIAYDEAIQECADEPNKMSSFCTARGESLDALYLDWISKVRVALKVENYNG